MKARLRERKRQASACLIHPAPNFSYALSPVLFFALSCPSLWYTYSGRAANAQLPCSMRMKRASEPFLPAVGLASFS